MNERDAQSDAALLDAARAIQTRPSLGTRMSSDSRSLLAQVVLAGEYDTLLSLIRDGAELNESVLFEGLALTPLMLAAGSRNTASVEMVKILMKAGADPARVVNGRSAAYYACVGLPGRKQEGGGAEVLSILLAGRASRVQV